MDKERFEQLKAIVNLGHHTPQMYFTVDDLKWLIEQGEKVEELQKEIERLTILSEIEEEW